MDTDKGRPVRETVEELGDRVAVKTYEVVRNENAADVDDLEDVEAELREALEHLETLDR